MRGPVRRAARNVTRATARVVGNAATRLLRGFARPPPCALTKRIDYVMRYTLTEGSNQAITVNDLLDSVFTAASSTTGNRIFQAIKIRRIEVWGLPMLTAGLTDINFLWGAGQNGQDIGNPAQLINDASMGSNDPAHICVTPPKNTVAAMWQSSTNNTDPLFYVEAPVSSVMDLHLSAILFDGSGGGTGFTQGPIISSLTGATAGTLYNRTLPANSATGWVPIAGIVI